MKKIVLIVTIIFLALSCPLFPVSYADTKTENTSSAGSGEDKGLKESDLTGEGEDVTSSGAKALGMVALGAGGEVYSGGIGKGVLLSPLLSESFQTDLATGSATVSIPIVVPPGRKNMQPSLALSYSSNNANGICGVGWGLTTSSIQRSTKKGTPKYDDTDTFVFASSGSSGELILIDAATNEYRQKLETAFMKYVFDDRNSKWDVWDKNGTKYTFGKSPDSRIVNPNDGTQIFAWFLDKVEDVYGNKVLFTYIKGMSQIYLSKIDYAGNDIVSPALSADKSVNFIYGTGRTDILYNYRSGWNIETDKRLNEIQVKVDGALKWRYALTYSPSIDTNRSLLSEITLFDAAGNSLPPKRFGYQTVE